MLACRNLLPGTLEYNDKVLSIKRVLPQSEAEVLAAIEQASPAWQAQFGKFCCACGRQPAVCSMSMSRHARQRRCSAANRTACLCARPPVLATPPSPTPLPYLSTCSRGSCRRVAARLQRTTASLWRVMRMRSWQAERPPAYDVILHPIHMSLARAEAALRNAQLGSPRRRSCALPSALPFCAAVL